MYIKHFGLEQCPFSLTSDSEFFFDHGGYKDALDVLDYGLSTGEGFIKVTGEAGTGKTLLCRKLINLLDKRFVTVHLNNPHLDPMALQSVVARALGIKHGQRIGQAQLLELISERLLSLHDKQKHVVLLIDEAHALSDDSMDALRILSNLETEKSKLLQIVLFGQPELDSRLLQGRLQQLGQRILYGCSLKPLTLEELKLYLRHRLQVSGCQSETIFGSRTLKLLHCASDGVPRLVNVLAHKSMLAAFGRGDCVIRGVHVQQAIADSVGRTRQRQITSLKTTLFSVLSFVPAGL